MTPNLDALDHATLRHLVAWLDHTTDSEDRVATQMAVEAGLAYDPSAVDRGDTWSQIGTPPS